jgi:predicted TIM-barrel fold metal-dependent hydrolase
MKSRSSGLRLVDFEPKSMLKVRETRVERPRFPVIDFHTHLSMSPQIGDPAPGGGEPDIRTTPKRALSIMDGAGVRTLVNVTGGCGSCLQKVLTRYVNPHPDRFVVFTEPWWQKVNEPGYPRFQAEQLHDAQKAGARGLKILKTLGLGLRENVTRGRLITIDDERFDPMWEAAGALKMPVLIHASDPEAFFLPIDRRNERYEELHVHPEWSFHGDFPDSRELHEARNRVVARHPNTQFVLAHAGRAEDLAGVSEWLDRHANLHVDFAARIGELGRQPRAARAFFERYQDRILFATDAIPDAPDFPQQTFCEDLYRIYFRFLETKDEYFDYSPARVPPQGRWRISGLGLPERTLRKVYFENAERLLSVRRKPSGLSRTSFSRRTLHP